MHRTGWIKLWRSIWDHNLFVGEPFSRRDAWHYLIAWAAWEPTERRRFQGIHFDLSRGQHITTERQLGRDFRWSKNKVGRFLNELENESMIVTKTDRRCLLVTICNYELYQSNETETDHARTTKRTTRGPQKAHEVRREEEQQHQEEENPEKKPYPRAQAKRPMHDFSVESDPLNKIAPLESLLLFSEPEKIRSVPEDLKADLSKACTFATVWQLVYHAERQVNPGGYIRDAIRKRYVLAETLTHQEADALRVKFFSNGNGTKPEPTTIPEPTTSGGENARSS